MNLIRQKLANMTYNKMRPASMRLHLYDAPTIHEHETIIDAIVRPYFAFPRSAEETGWPKFREDRDRFKRAVENLAKVWTQYFSLYEPAASRIIRVSSSDDDFFAMWMAKEGDLRQYGDWYGC